MILSICSSFNKNQLPRSSVVEKCRMKEHLVEACAFLKIDYKVIHSIVDTLFDSDNYLGKNNKNNLLIYIFTN